MGGQGEIIKSFLVGLGFEVDDSSLAMFNKSIRDAAIRVTALYGTINAFAGSMVYAFAKISEGFEEMGYQYHIIAPAINKAIVLRNELMKAYSAAGINIRKVIVDSINLNMSLAKTKFAMEAIYKSVASRFFGVLQKQSDAFRKKLYENMPAIINILEKLVKGVFRAFAAVTQLGSTLWSVLVRIYDFFVTLDKATGGWSTTIMAVVAAWKFLNLEFLATPLGAIIAGFVALLALWDDFKTYKEGGLSLVDWGSDSVKAIVGVVAIVGTLAGAIYGVVTAIRVWQAAQIIINGLMLLNPIGLIVAGVTALIGLLGILAYKWGLIKFDSFSTDMSGFGGKVLDFFGGLGAPKVSGPPLGANQSVASQTNVNAKMQTDIHITGSANADATARATAAQQQGVNRDMTRNLKGVTR